MTPDLASVTPSVLGWARHGVGLSLQEGAKQASVPPERLAAWEAGQGEPTVAKLRLLADYYLQSLAVFFLPEPPAPARTVRDFRRLSTEADGPWGRALHKVYRRALMQQATAVELLEQEGDLRPARIPGFELADPPEQAGDAARAALDVSLTDQWSWKRPEEAFAGWLQAVESLGVLVLRSSDVPMETMRGFSLSGDHIPVIVVNALDAPRGQVFTLAHELAHLMLRAVLLRLVTLNPASRDLYAARRQRYLSAYTARRDQQRQRRRSTPGGGPPRHRMVIRDQGKPYIRLVLDRDAISLSSLSALLDIRVDHLPKLEKELGAL